MLVIDAAAAGEPIQEIYIITICVTFIIVQTTAGSDFQPYGIFKIVFLHMTDSLCVMSYFIIVVSLLAGKHALLRPPPCP